MPIEKHALSPNQRIQRYHIIDVLGAGGFGNVYLANHVYLNYEVVIKEFFPKQIAARVDGMITPVSSNYVTVFQDSKRRFEQECITLLDLRHPNIVTVLDCFRHADTIYMVMKKEEAVSLDKYARVNKWNKNRVFTWEEISRLVWQIMDGLDYIHKCHKIHRDIKPDNIVLKHGSLDKPVIIDFGLVKSIDTPGVSQFVPYTEGYAPYEQECNTGDMGPPTDIYALAMVIIRMLSGWLPLRATALEKDPLILETHLGQMRGYVPGHVCTALAQATTLLPDKRTQTIAEFRSKLFPRN